MPRGEAPDVQIGKACGVDLLGRDAERDAAASGADALGLVARLTILPNRMHPTRCCPTRGLAEVHSGIPLTQHGKETIKDSDLLS